MRIIVIASVSLLALALLVQRAAAERPPEGKEEATHVVTGVIKEISTKESKFGTGGIQTDYTAEVLIGEVQKGAGLKAGETVKVRWFHVTKRPSKPLPGAYGHGYAVKKGDRVRVYLMKRGEGYEVIYNAQGIEAVKGK